MPPRPLSAGVFDFPAYWAVWPRWCGLSIWLAIVLALVRADIGLLSFGRSPAAIGPWIGSVFATLLAVIGGCGCWISLSAVLLAVLEDTSDGLDQIENWPPTALANPHAAIFTLNALTFAALPGIAVGALASAVLGSGAGWIAAPLSVVALFPPVLLSMLADNSPLMPFSRPVWRSLRSVCDPWTTFYLRSAALVGLTGIVAGLGWWLGTFWSVPLAALPIVGALLIYFRLLGRLAWICAVESSDDDEPPDDDDDPAEDEAAPSPSGAATA